MKSLLANFLKLHCSEGTILNNNKVISAASTMALAATSSVHEASVITPQLSAPPIDTSAWPLLLANYSNCARAPPGEAGLYFDC
jgi:hypothetical protein